jgi:hypothetical protein
MMNPASLPHEKLIQAIRLIGTRVVPTLRKDGLLKTNTSRLTRYTLLCRMIRETVKNTSLSSQSN